MTHFPVIDGKACASCGRTKRCARTRRCMFCIYWNACALTEGNGGSPTKRGEAWLLIFKMRQDHRAQETGRRARNMRRGRQRDADGSFTTEQARAILRFQDGHCAYCDVREGLHLDHVVPLSRGGSNWPWNLQWLCAHHNISKNSLTDAEYRPLIGLPPAIPPGMLLWSIVFSVI